MGVRDDIKILEKQLKKRARKKLDPVQQIQKIDLLIMYYSDIDEIDKSDEWAKELINYATDVLSDLPFENQSDVYKIIRKAYIHLAPRDFHYYMIALEWDRDPEQRFYQPRLSVFREVADWLTKLMTDEIDILCLSMPPGVGKSTLGIFFLSWVIGRNPMKPNLASAYSDKLTKSFYIGVYGIATDPEYNYHEIFPKIDLTNQNSKDEWIDFRDDGKKIAKRFPSLTCRSIDGSLTGATRCEGVLYSDDLVAGIEQALNLERMNKLWEKYGTDLKSRKKKGCKEIHIATRWSLHDPIGKLKMMFEDDPRFVAIELPALDENMESNFDYDYDVGFDTKYFLEAKNTMDEVSFLCLYQQQPIERDGLLFPESMLKRYFNLPDKMPVEIISFCDVAFGGADSLSMPVGYVYENGDVYIEDVVFMKGDYLITEPIVSNKIIEHRVQTSTFESNNGGDFYARDIETYIRTIGYKCNIRSEKAPSTMSKLARIIQHAPAVREFYFRDKSTYATNSMYAKFMLELTTFVQTGKAPHDDAPDSICSLANMIRTPIYGRISIIKEGRSSI